MGCCSAHPSEEYAIGHHHINMSASATLNEKVPNSGLRLIVASPSDYSNFENNASQALPCVESESDGELLFKLHFDAGIIKLKSIKLLNMSSKSETKPAKVKAYVNPPTDLDFSNISQVHHTQDWSVPQDSNSLFNVLHTRISKFSQIKSLYLLVSNERDEDDSVVMLNWLGLEGEFTRAASDAGPIITTYELTPNLADHPQTQSNLFDSNIGM